jgi:hypothetical protein
METARDMLQALGGIKTVSAALGQKYYTVLRWQQRSVIPAKHWPGIIGLARRKKVAGIHPNSLLRANEVAR